MQNIPAGKGTGLLPAGQQQSLTWHMSPSKISCGPWGSKVVMPQEAPPAWRPAGREGRAAGRRALLLSELFPHLPPLTSGLESPGSVCWWPWESCWSMHCCCADGQTDAATSISRDGSSACSWLCIPSALWPVTQIPATAQGFMPLASLGKAGERPPGRSGEAEAERPCVPSAASADVSTGRRRLSRGHLWVFWGLL